jgi:hypothetical protein
MNEIELKLDGMCKCQHDAAVHRRLIKRTWCAGSPGDNKVPGTNCYCEHFTPVTARPDDHGECCKHSESDHYEHRFDDWNDGCSKCADRHGFIPCSARSGEPADKWIDIVIAPNWTGEFWVHGKRVTSELIAVLTEYESLRSQLAAEITRREDANTLNEHGMLPCPRCGGHVALMSDDHNNPTWWTAHCDCLIKLDLLVEIGDDTREGLIRKLNMRPAQAPGDTSEDGAGPEVDNTKS